MGEEPIDPADEDMVDAWSLAIPDGMGGTLWRPSTLDDIHSLPYVTWHLFLAYRSGANARSEPWRWWVANRVQHQFRVTFEGYPNAKARCGAPKVDGMTQDENATTCTACERLSKGEPASFGTIGD